MDNIKICVAICNYNHLKYLSQSIKSIQEQTHANLDICIVDDNSENQADVKALVNSFMINDDRIRLILNEQNKGKWHCLNEAFRTTSAQVCTSNDADDVSLKDRLEIQLKTMVFSETTHNLCTHLDFYDDDKLKDHYNNSKLHDGKIEVIDPNTVKNLVLKGYQIKYKMGLGLNHYFVGNYKTTGASAMFDREIWLQGIRFNPPGHGLRVLVSEDSDFNFRCTALIGKTSIVNLPLYLYRRETSTNEETF
jgi:glycosyltransferase involved in cell wall biosynthesis